MIDSDGVVAELGRRVEAEGRIAAALVELERHPGHQLLTTGPLAGATAARWAVARESLSALWTGFAHHQRIVAAAQAVRARRARPGEAELAELVHLLREPTVEMRRTLVERRLTGDVVAVEHVTLQQLSDRMDLAYRGVHELVDACADLHQALLRGLAPLAARAADARTLAHELGQAGLADAVTAQIQDLDSDGTADPLALADGALQRRLAVIDTELTAVASRLAEQAVLRAGWPDTLATLTAGIAALEPARAAAEQAHRQAAELIVAALPPLPPDQRPALQERLQLLDTSTPVAVTDWPRRARDAAELRGHVQAATAALQQSHELAAGLLERRTELRGRYDAFRAKAARTGYGEHPELLALDEEIRLLLWCRPCDLGAATRALGNYQRVLQSIRAPTPGASREQGRSA
ncbi:hypothetical protein [Pseudonocardia sp. GCM10023141]|uniref:hypothetical protein n=1 Tax=Pseudonocardia sp. GCM10023141 TaxID=3252653 RepID=UPI0036131E33